MCDGLEVEALPLELWALIFKHLPTVPDVLHLAQTNKAFYDSLWSDSESTIWKGFLVKYLRTLPPAFQSPSSSSTSSSTSSSPSSDSSSSPSLSSPSSEGKRRSLREVSRRLHEAHPWKEIFTFLVHRITFADSLIRLMQNERAGFFESPKMMEGVKIFIGEGNIEKAKHLWRQVCVEILNREKGSETALLNPQENEVVIDIVAFLADIARGSPSICETLFMEHREWMSLWNPQLPDNNTDFYTKYQPFYLHTSRLWTTMHIEFRDPNTLQPLTELILPNNKTWGRKRLTLNQLQSMIRTTTQWVGRWTSSYTSWGDPSMSEWTPCTLDLDTPTISSSAILRATGTDRKGKFRVEGTLEEDEQTGMCLFRGTKYGWGNMECQGYVDGDGIIGRWQWGSYWYGCFILRPLKALKAGWHVRVDRVVSGGALVILDQHDKPVNQDPLAT